jgi:hypothetical protein
MKKLAGWFAGVAVVAVATLGVALGADEEKVAIDKLPKAVVDAIKARFAGAELKAAEKETEGGKTVYDVEIKYKGANYEVAVTPEGKITGYEKQIDAKDMPSAASKALEDKYPKATIKLVEEVYKVEGREDKFEYYEVALVTADKKKVEAHVAKDGKILKAKEEKKKE